MHISDIKIRHVRRRLHKCVLPVAQWLHSRCEDPTVEKSEYFTKLINGVEQSPVNFSTLISPFPEAAQTIHRNVFWHRVDCFANRINSRLAVLAIMNVDNFNKDSDLEQIISIATSYFSKGCFIVDVSATTNQLCFLTSAYGVDATGALLAKKATRITQNDIFSKPALSAMRRNLLYQN